MSAEPIAEPTDESSAASAASAAEPSDGPPTLNADQIAEPEGQPLQQAVAPVMPPPVYWGMPMPIPMPAPAPPPERLWARLFAGWCLLAAGLLGLAGPFTEPEGTRVFKVAVLDVSFAAWDGTLVVIAVLLLLNKARNLSVGMALGFSGVIVAQSIDVLRAGFSHLSSMGYFSLAAFVATVLGGVIAAEIRPGRRDVAGHNQSARARTVAAVVGGVGGVCWFVGQCMNWDRITDTPIGGNAESIGTYTRSCCTFGGSSGWQQTSLILTCAVILLLAIFAATARSRTHGAGMLIAAAIATLPNILAAVYGAISPAAPYPGYSVYVVLIVGFWVAVGGTVLVLGAGALRLTAGRRPTTVAGAAATATTPAATMPTFGEGPATG